MAVYIFFDESGCLHFSTSGTKYYIFGALTTRTPGVFDNPLGILRYNLISDGTKIEYFHAAEDR